MILDGVSATSLKKELSLSSIVHMKKPLLVDCTIADTPNSLFALYRSAVLKSIETQHNVVTVATNTTLSCSNKSLERTNRLMRYSAPFSILSLLLNTTGVNAATELREVFN